MVSMVKGIIAWLLGTNKIVDETGSMERRSEDEGDETIPHANIRLQITHDVVHIFGFPHRPPYETLSVWAGYGGQPFLYLRDEIPAYVDYVMGSDWRSRLFEVAEHEGQVILRPGGSGESNATEEEQHCLRMRRCGAVVIVSHADAIARMDMYSPSDPQPAERQIFGWPKEGGVWILRAPVDPRRLELEEQLAMWEGDPDGLERQQFEGVRETLKGVADMEALCEVLRKAGGEYYADATDCPEVQTLGL